METIIADGILYERVFPLYPGEYEPPPDPPARTMSRKAEALWSARESGLTPHERILKAMELGDTTRSQMTSRLRTSNGQLTKRLNELISQGVVEMRVNPAGHGSHGKPQQTYHRVDGV